MANNIWIDHLQKVEEVRELQRKYFETKSKLYLAKSKVAEVELDQMTRNLKKIAIEKGMYN
ncbi:hypothetical protein DN752_19500 [Echinicola strongylocentroti]|uniref:Uncharacterized protein n=1 Tax=Echinicola strongylocentroti TaxID=1795355 RepID=A0A2Z4IN42_9BACT|nr:hypothetical protein [Echinicola strongylocentroti]AWW32149.1 hypothetical protein DN752_19500 [Echinicola strongylocentroti]